MTTSSDTTNSTAPTRGVPAGTGAMVIDAVCVVVFAAIGYATHADELTLAGTASTAWPFLAALFLTHAALQAAGRPATTLTAGAIVWLTTVAVGMVLRQVAGDGTALAFVIVATAFNAATLLGWRALAALVRR